MFLRGINYDVGTSFRENELSRPDFDEPIIKKEIEIIKNDLHCDSIRISGYDINRLSKASEFALQQGLQVWFSPSYLDATREDVIKYLLDCAIAAEKLRVKYKDVIFVVGFEYSIFLKGLIKGDTIYDRLDRMFSPWGLILNLLGLRQGIYDKLNLFLKEVTKGVREHFNGMVTYGSGTWEKINWSLFDIVGIDHYRASYNKAFYTKQLEGYYKFNKPIAILEFGCCAYKGAEEKGPSGWAITEVADGKRVIKGSYLRDEDAQANYITELLDIFKQENVYGAFVFTFINPMYKYNSNPKLDLDLASYGIVKPVDDVNEGSYKGLSWTPKKAFYSLADYYKGLNKDNPSTT
ncbi:MAG TPA: hypothetical protein VK668_17000 [Mucilaginibacter sp.]|nr:hypothetical protein [Mucilaginibacter sp.]